MNFDGADDDAASPISMAEPDHSPKVAATKGSEARQLSNLGLQAKDEISHSSQISLKQY